jgi:hypothetical protein
LQTNPENLVGLLGIHVLLEHDAELLAQRLELSEVLLVLALVLDLGLDACLGNQSVSVPICGSGSGGYFPHGGGGRTLEDADGGGEVVDSPGGPEGGGQDGRGGDEIVGEGVVQVALWLLDGAGDGDKTGRRAYLKLENVLDAVKLLLVAIRH